MELDIPCGNFNRENGTTFLDFPLLLGIFQWNEPTKRVPFTAEPEIPGILTKWKAPLTIYLPSGISETFCQVVRTPGQFRHCWARQIRHKQAKMQFVCTTLSHSIPCYTNSNFPLAMSAESNYILQLYSMCLPQRTSKARQRVDCSVTIIY